jgi:hypothetical protein
MRHTRKVNKMVRCVAHQPWTQDYNLTIILFTIWSLASLGMMNNDIRWYEVKFSFVIILMNELGFNSRWSYPKDFSERIVSMSKNVIHISTRKILLHSTHQGWHHTAEWWRNKIDDEPNSGWNCNDIDLVLHTTDRWSRRRVTTTPPYFLSAFCSVGVSMSLQYVNMDCNIIHQITKRCVPASYSIGRRFGFRYRVGLSCQTVSVFLQFINSSISSIHIAAIILQNMPPTAFIT